MIDANEDEEYAPCPASAIPCPDNKGLHYPVTPTGFDTYTHMRTISFASGPLLGPSRPSGNPWTTSPGRLRELSSDCTCAHGCPPEGPSLTVFISLGTEVSVGAQRVLDCR